MLQFNPFSFFFFLFFFIIFYLLFIFIYILFFFFEFFIFIFASDKMGYSQLPLFTCFPFKDVQKIYYFDILGWGTSKD